MCSVQDIQTYNMWDLRDIHLNIIVTRGKNSIAESQEDIPITPK